MSPVAWVKDPNARNKYGLTPLQRAVAWSTTPGAVTALLDAGADVNARAEKGATSLHEAARFSEPPGIVTALLDAGANPEARDKGGKTPWDHIKAVSPLKGTDVYWRLHEGRFR